MYVVVIQTSEPDSTREATEILLKIFKSTYAKADLKQVANNATQMKAEKRTQLLRLLKYFKDLFDVTLGDWDGEPVNLEVKPSSKTFTSIYYPVPKI